MTTGVDRGGPAMASSTSSASTMTGWVVFGGVMLMVIGIMNFIQGITALQYDELLVSSYVYENLTFWGWAFLIWGGLQLVAGVLALSGSAYGPSIGIVLGSVSAIGWFFMIFAAPAAALVGIAASVAIIASLSTAFSD